MENAKIVSLDRHRSGQLRLHEIRTSLIETNCNQVNRKIQSKTSTHVHEEHSDCTRWEQYHMTLEKTNHSAFTLRRTEAGDTCDLFFRFLPLNAHPFITRTVHRGGAQPLSLFRSLETLNMEPETSHPLLIFTYKLLPIVT